MKIKNNWKTTRKQWDKLMLRVRVSYVDIFNIEIDISRKFYLITVLNFTLKNR